MARNGLQQFAVIAIVVLAIIAVVYYLQRQTSGNKENSEGQDGSGNSFISAADENDLIAIFNAGVTAKYDEISKCVLDKFLERYTYAEAEALINADAFKTNPAIIADLKACQFDALKQWYSVAKLAVVLPCGQANKRFIVDWVLTNIPYKEHTDVQIQGYLAKLRDAMSVRCWKPEQIANAVDKINLAMRNFIKARIENEKARGLFILYQRYGQWFGLIATVAVNKIKAEITPEEFDEYLKTATFADLDSKSDDGLSKIDSQVKILNATMISWCKPIIDLFRQMESIPMEKYTDAQVAGYSEELLKKWCWNTSALQPKTISVLKTFFA